jgi:hypothetical protein
MSPELVTKTTLRPCCMCGRPDQPRVDVSLPTIKRTVQITLCRWCYEVVEPNGTYPHPETCKCQGTMCRHVGEQIVDDPCEEAQEDGEPWYDFGRLRDEALTLMIREHSFGTANARWWELGDLISRERYRQHVAREGVQK